KKKHISHHFNNFQQNTSFNTIFQFYLINKSLHILITNTLKHIKIHLKTIITHKLKQHNPLTHLNHSNIIQSTLTIQKNTPTKTLSLHST
ncbi:hypothetical protein GUF79_06950, partial [Xanthomonas citri pv. citri]|nr:hypothetical protein [Xanthomonas citri pv. citri]